MKFFIISRKIKTYTLQRYYHITFYIYKIKFLYLYHLYKPATYFCTILPFSFPFFSPKNIYFMFFHIHENKTTFFSLLFCRIYNRKLKHIVWFMIVSMVQDVNFWVHSPPKKMRLCYSDVWMKWINVGIIWNQKVLQSGIVSTKYNKNTK